MIIHEHKLIFIHIPKCAGRSIADAFGLPFDHYTAAYYHQQHTELWNEYRKFTIVRNPLDRFVSMYHYMMGCHHRRERICLSGTKPDFKKWLTANINAYQPDHYSFESVQGMRETDASLGSSFWFGSQRQRLCDVDQNLYEDINIYKFENLHSIHQLLKELTGKDIAIPHANKSNHRDYLSYYDQRLLQLIKLFSPAVIDCQNLGY